MKILWFTWKDLKNPIAGGAEVVNEELAKRLVADGHEVIFVVGGFAAGQPEEIIDGYKVIRIGGRFSVYWYAYRYYKQHLVGWADLVIDEVNTIPFFAKFYVKEPNILFVHQLAREIWFYQMLFPLSLIGYLVEPIYLWLLRDRKTITVSNSTKKDLMRFGHKYENISIISEGIQFDPVEDLATVQKYDRPTLLSLGAVRPMKRTLDIVKAFEIVRRDIHFADLCTSDLRLIIAGDTSGTYGQKVLQYIANSPYQQDIEVLGRVDEAKKIELLQKSHAIAVTSVKEGWGLIVTEANSQGTPAVVYNVDGLRDSVQHRNTGLVCTKNLPEDLATSIVNLLTIPKFYERLRRKGWEWSKEVTFERSYEDLKNTLHI